MLRLLAVGGLLTVALSMLEAEFDFGGDDETVFGTLLREQGFSEEEIEMILEEDREDREEVDNEEEEEYVSWSASKGYEECEEFMWWRKKYGHKDMKEEDWADKKKQWRGYHGNDVNDPDVKEGDVIDQYKFDGSGHRGHHSSGHRGHHSSSHRGHHGSSHRGHHGSGHRGHHSSSHRGHHSSSHRGHHGSSHRGHHGSGHRGHHGSGHRGHPGKHGHHGKKRRCPKPKPLYDICAEYECPPVERLNISGCGFEARRVLSAKWVVTTIDTTDMRRGYKEAFWRLFKYLHGANEQGVRVDMTVPVVNKWFLDEQYQVAGAQMAFYISSRFQADPPTPTNDLVIVETWEDVVTYDRAFGGDRDDPEYYKKQFLYLWKALAREDITPYPKMSITAGYTRPGRGRQRKEVMLLDNESM